jgi:cell division protein FtsQ
MRSNRRRRRFRDFFPALVRLAAVAGGAGLAMAAAPRIARWVEGHPYFRLAAVAVEGAEDPERVLHWAGIEPGTSLWSIDPAEVERRLAERPRVVEAHVERIFPDRLRIRVVERRPVVALLVDPPLVADREGRLFPPLDRERLADRPYVTGIGREDLENRPHWVEATVREAVRLLQLWNRHPEWPRVSEIRAVGDGEFVIHPERFPMAVRFGRRAGEREFAELSAVLEIWRGREAHVAAIDLTVPGQAVLRLRGVGRAERGRLAV